MSIVHQASAQQLNFNKIAATDTLELAKAMPELAKQAITIYEEPDRDQYLNALFRLQIVAGQYPEAATTLRSLAESRRAANPASALRLLPFEILAKARTKQATSGLSFDEAFKQEFRDVFDLMEDKSAYEALPWFWADLSRARNDLRSAVEKQKDKDSIALTDALDLIRKYQFYQAFQAMMPLANTLAVEADNKRYIIEDSVLIKTKEGATLSAIVVRKKGVATPQPAALFFNIYTNLSLNAAKRAAAYGYVGVAAETRGKRLSPDEIVPYEHEAKDTYGVIDWISQQSWSNGKVGMYGGSYSGFACWAAAKNPHPALKTIVPYCANNPGDGLPMENNVFLFVNYAWAFYVTNNKYLDNETYFDRKRWNSLNDKWYASGKSYRQIDNIDGTPNKLLQRWLQHPSYDSYWQKMVPYKDEFAKINIPVLTITGYYDDGQQSALHYLKEHYKYNKNANHYLLIGPYDHVSAQSSRKPPVLNGYAIDPVAQIDTPEITFQWLDYVMRDGKKPELLKEKINYQVMGANEWKHAPSFEKMSNEMLTLYLTDSKAGDY